MLNPIELMVSQQAIFNLAAYIVNSDKLQLITQSIGIVFISIVLGLVVYRTEKNKMT